FFFQAEDGIRDGHVTGVQTCALPIFLQGRCVGRSHSDRDRRRGPARSYNRPGRSSATISIRVAPSDASSLKETRGRIFTRDDRKIGRASCRERGVRQEQKGLGDSRKR